MKRIYLDYAALTPIDKGVIKIMNKYSKDEYTNPSALYHSAVNAKKVLDESRLKIANILHAHSDEIIFNSGGTESNHLILNNFTNKNIIISSIEHSSIINYVNSISDNVIRIPVDENGILDLEILKNSITEKTDLISIIMVNNEIGTLQSINEISKIIRDAKKKFNKEIFFHIDACQAITHYPLYIEKLGVDSITLDSHKVYGPRGIGILFIKRNTIKINREGTYNIPSIVGFTYALELNEKIREKETERIIYLKNYFLSELLKINSLIKVNGNLNNSSPHILNISIPNIDSEYFVLQLDAKGIECSTKSACLRDENESYVIKAINGNSGNSLRFSFGRKTSKGDLKRVINIIKKILINNVSIKK